jgi:hypothetical protein
MTTVSPSLAELMAETTWLWLQPPAWIVAPSALAPTPTAAVPHTANTRMNFADPYTSSSVRQ